MSDMKLMAWTVAAVFLAIPVLYMIHLARDRGGVPAQSEVLIGEFDLVARDASEMYAEGPEGDTRTEALITDPDDPDYYVNTHQPPVDLEISRTQLPGQRDAVIDFKLLRQTRPDGTNKPIFPDTLLDLNGQEVEIVGFMAPFDSMERMNTFMLFPYPVGCYFCAPPSLAEVMLVRQARSDDAPYMDDAIRVRGVLNLWHPDIPEDREEAGFLFTIDQARVETYQPTEK